MERCSLHFFPSTPCNPSVVQVGRVSKQQDLMPPISDISDTLKVSAFKTLVKSLSRSYKYRHQNSLFSTVKPNKTIETTCSISQRKRQHQAKSCSWAVDGWHGGAQSRGGVSLCLGSDGQVMPQDLKWKKQDETQDFINKGSQEAGKPNTRSQTQFSTETFLTQTLTHFSLLPHSEKRFQVQQPVHLSCIHCHPNNSLTSHAQFLRTPKRLLQHVLTYNQFQ